MATSPLRHDGLVGRWSSLLPGSCGLEPNRPYGTELVALDVVAVLDNFGVHRAVYGTSTGGRLARQLAARHPHLVRALGLGCASPGGPHGIERDSVVSRSLAQARTSAARQALLGLTYTPAWLATEAGRRHPRSAPGQQTSPGRLAWGSCVERVTRIELAL
ncbi:alpha/beta fold hydrolase [Streptomyces rubiginosohelvolus]|uniref:alpha/beta fold hydrolase n=1 Tax=Streptomyces rubiginosohelvolus TaxID=67362 RepID=UPI00370338BE